MKIHNEPMTFKPEAISALEKHYNGKYVFESTIKGRDGRWLDQAFAIFYTENAHPEGSNYFAIGWQSYPGEIGQSLIITDGISATKEFSGVLYNGEVYYSRFGHDFRQCTGNLFVDGGRDYLRVGGSVLNDIKYVKIRVNKDKLEVVNEEVPDPNLFDVANSYISGYSA